MFRTLSVRYDHGHEIGDHEHVWGQLVFAAAGAIHVATPARTWLIPSARAVWLPAGTEHRLRMRGPTDLRTIYVPPAYGAGLPDDPHGVSVDPLLRELILELVRFGHVEADNPHHRAIGTAFLAMLGEAKPLPHMLAMPTDRRAQRVAAAIAADPACDVPLARIAGESAPACARSSAASAMRPG